MEATKSQTKSSTANGAIKDKSSFFSFGKSVANNAPFFQPKLSINTPGDVYEQQADAVADHILNASVQNLISPVAKPVIAPSPIQKDEDGPRQEEQNPVTDGLGVLGENLMDNNPLFAPFLDRLKYRFWDSQPGELRGGIIGFGIADALILGTVFAMDPRFRGQAINALDGVNLMTPIRLIPNSEYFTPSSFNYHLPAPGHPTYEFNGEFDLTPYFDFLHEHNNAFPQISPRFGLNLDYNPATQSLRVVGGTFNLDLFNRAVTLQGGVNQFFNPNPSLLLPNDPFSQPVTSMLTLPAEQIRDTRFSITIDVPRLINVIRGVPDTTVTRKPKSTDGDTLFRKEEVAEQDDLVLRKIDLEEEKKEEIFRKEDTRETTTSTSAIGDQNGQNLASETPLIISRKETSGQGESPALQQVQQALSGNGFGLDNETKGFMEDRFQHDFTQVKIHNDSIAHQSSSAINALAYTNQNDIVFGQGQYNPSSAEGKKLLAHELTHVVQQGEGIQNKLLRQTTLPEVTVVGDPHFYDRALRSNRYYHQHPNIAGWPYLTQLRTLWSASQFDDFADAVREYQEGVMHLPGGDGILGPATATAMTVPGAESIAVPHVAPTVITLESLRQNTDWVERRVAGVGIFGWGGPFRLDLEINAQGYPTRSIFLPRTLVSLGTDPISGHLEFQIADRIYDSLSAANQAVQDFPFARPEATTYAFYSGEENIIFPTVISETTTPNLMRVFRLAIRQEGEDAHAASGLLLQSFLLAAGLRFPVLAGETSAPRAVVGTGAATTETVSAVSTLRAFFNGLLRSRSAGNITVDGVQFGNVRVVSEA